MVLAEMAALSRSSVRGTDAVIRYGGDEFLVILADTSQADAGKVIQRIRAYMQDWNQAKHLDDFEVSFSIGVSEWSDGKTLDDVLDDADRRMYAVKADSKTIVPS
jgi:diguanylate cyclase